MYIDELIAELYSRFDIKVSRKNLSNTLNRWISGGKRLRIGISNSVGRPCRVCECASC